MKKLLPLVFALMLGLSFARAQEETPAFAPTDSTVLVACFSATGNTWPLAAYAAEYLNADLFRIEPEVPYTDADLNYSDSGCRSQSGNERRNLPPGPGRHGREHGTI